jgi:hypothetical protein
MGKNRAVKAGCGGLLWPNICQERGVHRGAESEVAVGGKLPVLVINTKHLTAKRVLVFSIDWGSCLHKVQVELDVQLQLELLPAKHAVILTLLGQKW